MYYFRVKKKCIDTFKQNENKNVTRNELT